jgi:hypothetical protein
VGDRIQGALDEGRILILGAQILLGSLYRSAFEPGFDQLSVFFQSLVVIALVLIVAAFDLLILPVSYRWIVDRGAGRPQFLDFVVGVMEGALPVFGASMALTLFVAASVVTRHTGSVLLSVAGVSVGAIWLAKFRRGGRREHGNSRPKPLPEMSRRAEEPSLSENIKHVLTEARMVLPGAQALFGFQFITIVLADFDKLPGPSRLVHLISLLFTAVSVTLLMTPAAYHRIVNRGVNTTEFHCFAGRLLMLAMVPLALAIAADFYVVVQKVSGSLTLAVASGVILLALSLGLWFGLTAYLRRQLDSF